VPATPPDRRVAILSWSDARFDSRTRRVARSAIAAGYDVVVYARLEPGTRPEEVREGYRIVRVPFDVRQAFPPTRAAGRRRAAMRRGSIAGSGATLGPPGPPGRARRLLRYLARRPPLRTAVAALQLALLFPLRPLAWADALDQVAEPATVWHGMWAGSLPALDRLSRRLGGRTVYDSRDIFLHARSFGRLPRALVAPFLVLERRWARRADAVITVNDGYAGVLRQTLGVRVSAIVRNTPERITPPATRPDRIRAALGLPATTRIVLYQGRFMDERGIEPGMEAVLAVPDAVLVLLGFGRLRDALVAEAGAPPYLGRVFVLDGVPPEDLLDWTASADVALMAIPGTTLNHRLTTPNKLWEALAVGTPIVAADLPGMATVVRETGAGTLCDPASPASIAAAIRSILDLPEVERQALRQRAVSAAHDRYNWETQAEALLAVYDDLVGRTPARARAPAA
jgi:glycosyltransferase involved in cell wall biosynthesis